MPKISVYLPDELYREARDHGLPVSALAQRAIREALQAEANAAWLTRARARAAERQSRRHAGPPTAELLDEVRAEFGS